MALSCAVHAPSVAPVVLTSSTSSTRQPVASIARRPKESFTLSRRFECGTDVCGGVAAVRVNSLAMGNSSCRATACAMRSAWSYPRRQRRDQCIGTAHTTRFLSSRVAPMTCANCPPNHGAHVHPRANFMSRIHCSIGPWYVPSLTIRAHGTRCFTQNGHRCSSRRFGPMLAPHRLQYASSLSRCQSSNCRAAGNSSDIASLTGLRQWVVFTVILQ